MTRETSDCELCNFENPKATVTAVIIDHNNLLMLKRADEPFKGKWDFLGGYMDKDESPESALKREIKEEIGCDAELTFIKMISGWAEWKGKRFPVLSHFYLVDIGDQKIKLNNENSEYAWAPIRTVGEVEDIAFDTNIEMAWWLQENFIFELPQVEKLIKQLDPEAEVKEHSLYKAMLNGYVSRKYDGVDDRGRPLLVGMGWIFPRQTALRRQAVVEDMIVDQSQRGKGLGREILKDLLAWAKDQNMDMVELTTNAKREAANGLYKSEGFWLHETNHYLYNVKKDDTKWATPPSST
jgi:ADP-ribose pyrophosphatase YjhB (NUDIX family)